MGNQEHKWFWLADSEVPQLYSFIITSWHDVEVVELKTCYPVTVGPRNILLILRWNVASTNVRGDISQPMQRWRLQIRCRLQKKQSFATFSWWIEPLFREDKLNASLQRERELKYLFSILMEDHFDGRLCCCNFHKRQFNITAGNARENFHRDNSTSQLETPEKTFTDISTSQLETPEETFSETIQHHSSSRWRKLSQETIQTHSWRHQRKLSQRQLIITAGDAGEKFHR